MIRTLEQHVRIRGYLIILALGVCHMVVDIMHVTKLQNMNTWNKFSDEPISDISYTTNWLLQKNSQSVFELSVNEWPRDDKPHACHSGSGPWFYVDEKIPRELKEEVEIKIEHMVRSELVRVQENIATEWAVLQLFRTSPCRTYNMSKATLIIVPYLHYSHCFFSPGYWMRCGHVPDTKLDHLMESLTFRGGKSSIPHLFLAVYDDVMSHPKIMQNPLRLTSGPLSESQAAIVLPIFNDHPRYQPSQILQRSDFWWTTRPRTYSFAAIYDFGLNPRMSKKQSRRFRGYFWNMFHNTTGLLDKPYIVTDSVNVSIIHEIYQDSILCPILPGDTVWQRRFYDVMLNGCLPVILEWPAMIDTNTKSWHDSGIGITKVYPFMDSINYSDFVITAPVDPLDETNLTCILTAMKNILMKPEELRWRQLAMKEVVPYFTFGLGSEAHRFKDAFTKVLDALQKRL